jgi:hypothetical protein
MSIKRAMKMVVNARRTNLASALDNSADEGDGEDDEDADTGVSDNDDAFEDVVGPVRRLISSDVLD